MSAVARRLPESSVSAEFDVYDAGRATRVAQRQGLLADLLRDRGLDALLLSRAENVAWFSCGGDLTRGGAGGAGAEAGGATAAVFVTPAARVLVAANADSPHLFDRELPGLGFQLKERPWFEPPGSLIGDLCRGRAVGGDDGRRPGCDGLALADVSAELDALRAVLDGEERDDLAAVAADVAHAVEAVCRGTAAGRTERDLAGEVAHRMLRRGVVPVRVQAAADGRAGAEPHYAWGSSEVRRWCTLAAVGRRDGLHAACGRTFAFGAVPDDLADAHGRAALVQATGIRFGGATDVVTAGGGEPADWAAVWPRVRRIYEKFDAPDAWQRAPVAVRTGYRPVEEVLAPDTPRPLPPGTPLVWHARVGAASLCDTVLVDDDRPHVLTGMEEWPRLSVRVKGAAVDRPGVLVRG